jgi:hypothetical protein
MKSLCLFLVVLFGLLFMRQTIASQNNNTMLFKPPESDNLKKNRNESISHSDIPMKSKNYFGARNQVPSKISHPLISTESLSPYQYMQLVAGGSTAGSTGSDGPATSALISSGVPWVDTLGNVYIPDLARFRKVDPAGIPVSEALERHPARVVVES